MLIHADSVALYGMWEPRTPSDAVRLFDGYAGMRWIADGWALERTISAHPWLARL